MPGPYGLTPDGFVIKSKSEILADIEARQRADLGADWHTKGDPVASCNEMAAESLAQVWEELGKIYNSLDRSQAEDAALDMVGELTVTPRRNAAKSRITAQVQLEAGADIPAGDAVASIEGNPLARFVNAEPMVNTGEATAEFDVVFDAETAGPVSAYASTLTVIETQLSGWLSVNNATGADVGDPVESNADYRLRQVQELQAQGGGTVDGLRADLARLRNGAILVATSVVVLENTGSIPDADNLPPHSFEALIDGPDNAGDDDAIANYIWENKPPGITPHGALAVTVQDANGVDRTIRFARVTTRRIHVAVDVRSVPASFEMPSENEMAQAIVDATRMAGDPAFLGVGDDVYASAILCALLDAGAHPSIAVAVSFSSIQTVAAGSQTLTIGTRERATIDSDDIVFDLGLPS